MKLQSGWHRFVCERYRGCGVEVKGQDWGQRTSDFTSVRRSRRRVNMNNADLTLHKGNHPPPFAQIRCLWDTNSVVRVKSWICKYLGKSQACFHLASVFSISFASVFSISSCICCCSKLKACEPSFGRISRFMVGERNSHGLNVGNRLKMKK